MVIEGCSGARRRHAGSQTLVKVLIDGEGAAVTPARARELGVEVSVVFVRHDGWSLGAPRDLEDVAYRLWEREWVTFARRGQALRPITEYVANAV